MDGRIDLDSRPGRTVFSLVLPGARAGARAAALR
jgi:nitrogen-specific signal transduction histidine kinase